jgi:hypothetical protein
MNHVADTVGIDIPLDVGIHTTCLRAP